MNGDRPWVTVTVGSEALGDSEVDAEWALGSLKHQNHQTCFSNPRSNSYQGGKGDWHRQGAGPWHLAYLPG